MAIYIIMLLGLYVYIYIDRMILYRTSRKPKKLDSKFHGCQMAISGTHLLEVPIIYKAYGIVMYSTSILGSWNSQWQCCMLPDGCKVLSAVGGQPAQAVAKILTGKPNAHLSAILTVMKLGRLRWVINGWFFMGRHVQQLMVIVINGWFLWLIYP